MEVALSIAPWSSRFFFVFFRTIQGTARLKMLLAHFPGSKQ
jgi:hypothetical protein